MLLLLPPLCPPRPRSRPAERVLPCPPSRSSLPCLLPPNNHNRHNHGLRPTAGAVWRAAGGAGRPPRAGRLGRHVQPARIGGPRRRRALAGVQVASEPSQRVARVTRRPTYCMHPSLLSSYAPLCISILSHQTNHPCQVRTVRTSCWASPTRCRAAKGPQQGRANRRCHVCERAQRAVVEVARTLISRSRRAPASVTFHAHLHALIQRAGARCSGWDVARS